MKKMSHMIIPCRFNTASGMRSHVTKFHFVRHRTMLKFQYRKRYEITCDYNSGNEECPAIEFQYRKRYEITCDGSRAVCSAVQPGSFNTASGMRSHVTQHVLLLQVLPGRFNTASGMRSHVTRTLHHRESHSSGVSIPQAV